MVMASTGVNVPGGDGNPAAAASSSAAGSECHLRRRRRLSAPPAATVASGSADAAGPSRPRRPTASPPATSSSSEGARYTGEEDTEEEEGGEAMVGGLQPMGLAAAGAAPPPAQAWPVAFGSMELAGRMREMEDTISMHPGFFTWVDGTPMHFFGVFDGHGGTHVSALCRNQMHLILAEDLAAEASRFLNRRTQHLQTASSSAASSSFGSHWEERVEEERSWRAALLSAFARVDALASLACACGVATVPRCACPLSGVTSAIVGSTAVVALLAGGRIVVANCGDSRAVLCRGPAGAPPVPLSVDHKPDRPDERARIQSVGGQVIYINGPRVRGILAMSRALGDRFLRPEVISEPEITVTQRTEADQCLILASDGMWDAMSNETACAVARQCLEDGGHQPPPGAARNAPGAVGPNTEHRCDVTAAILASSGGPSNKILVWRTATQTKSSQVCNHQQLRYHMFELHILIGLYPFPLHLVRLEL